MSARIRGRFVSVTERTCWVWLVVLASTRVANAMIPQPGCDGADDDEPGMTALGGDDCDTWAGALNALDGVSGVDCGGNYPYLYGDGCDAWATALNKLHGVYNISCDGAWSSLVVRDVDCPGGPNGTLAALTAVLQGPTCKHGNPLSGPTGGGKCTGACDLGWQGTNCDTPGRYVCNSSTYRCVPATAPGSGANISSCSKTCTPPPPTPPPTPSPGVLDATLDSTGAVSLSVNGEPWLASGVTALRQKGSWYISDCPPSSGNTSAGGQTRCKALKHSVSDMPTSGTDAVGEYTQTSVEWSGDGDDTAQMVVGVRTYAGKPDVLSFVQTFPKGLEPQNHQGTTHEVVSAFPTFGSSARDLGVLFFGGVQLQDSRYFPWAAGTPIHSNDPGAPIRNGRPVTDGNSEGGMPLLLVDSESGASVVFSPLSDFFTATQAESKVLGNWSFGMQATLQSAPAGHEHITLVVAGRSARGAMMRWGDVFMGAAGAGKQRNMDWTEHGDVGLKYLSYYTDNGAYYYYHTTEGTCSDKDGTPGHSCVKETTPQGATGYVATLDALGTYFKNASLPIGSVQYDSWWYYKGPNSGVQLWEPEPSTLGGAAVDGQPSTWYQFAVDGTKLPTVTHSRYFEPENDYVTLKAPGLPADASQWVWVSSDSSSTSAHPATVSTSSGFYKHIFSRAQSGLGMATYEQDFLTNSYESIADLQGKVGLAKAWLTAMSDAANETNVTVQYCMSLPRHILQSASFPRVTHARASHDYGQSQAKNSQQWSELGLSATLYWALGILPFKDDFWSESVEPGNTWGSKEADPELQTLVSSLSAGPVGPADALQQVNATRVMQTCRKDGVLLKPSAPAMQLDSTYTAALHSHTVQDNGIAHVWHTVSSAKGVAPHNHIILAANITRATNISVAELKANAAEIVTAFGRDPVDVTATSYLAREYYSKETRTVSVTAPLELGPQTLKPQECAGRGFTHEYCTPFELWTLTPIPAGQDPIVLLGERGKYIGLSPQRFGGYQYTPTRPNYDATLQVELIGAPGEKVVVELAGGGAQGAPTWECGIGKSGASRVECFGGGTPTRCDCIPLGTCECVRV